jgi:hypothetical protein
LFTENQCGKQFESPEKTGNSGDAEIALAQFPRRIACNIYNRFRVVLPNVHRFPPSVAPS